tara:strand:- start:58374 stop:58868 length:495 start_codon:yes stop_codon:yes gene_type:complete
MKEIKVRRFVFEMERIALQHRICNSSVEFLEDFDKRGIIVDMTRRLAVRREMFENKDNPPAVTRKVETVTAELLFPVTWWDHAKLEVYWLARLVVRGLLKPARQRTHRTTKRVETERTEKHYIQAVTVLDDQKEIPANQQRIEFQYEERHRPTYEGGYDALDMD